MQDENGHEPASPLLVNKPILTVTAGPAGVQVNFDMPAHEALGLLTQVVAQMVQQDIAERRRAGAGIQVFPAGAVPPPSLKAV